MRKNPKSVDNQWWGKDSQAFLESVSRDAIEVYNENFVLYFQVDYTKSKRNFYGEYEIIEFTEKKGVAIKGIVTVHDQETEEIAKLINQNTILSFGCYVNHLKDLGIDIRLGNYFSYKNKFYYIYNKVALDANRNVVASGTDVVWNKYDCYQEDDEAIYGDGWRETSNEGSQDKIY